MKSKRNRQFKSYVDQRVSKSKKISSIKVLIEKKLYSKALSEIDEYLEQYPNDSYGLFKRAFVFSEIGEYDIAKEEFQYIIDNDLESKYSSMYMLARIETYNNNFDAAKDILKNLIEISPYDEINSIIHLADIYLYEGDTVSALDVINDYGNMKNDDIAVEYAKILNSMGREEQSYNLLISHEFKNKSLDYYYLKASIETKKLMFDTAKESLRMCECYRNSDKIIYLKARFCFASGDYNEAIKLFSSILDYENSGYREKAILSIGDIYGNLKDYDKARQYYLGSIDYQLYPSYKSYYYIGASYALEQNFKKAKEFYFKCINNSKSVKYRSLSYLRLAYISLRRNEIDECKSYIENINSDILSVKEKNAYSHINAIINYGENKALEDVSYGNMQIYDYSLDRLVEHLYQNHRVKGNSIFKEDINLDELVLQIPNLLEKSVLVDNSEFEHFQVEYKEIGYLNRIRTDYLEIVVIPNTKNVITMYPTKAEILISDSKDLKPYHKTMIDRFNKKYGIKSN